MSELLNAACHFGVVNPWDPRWVDLRAADLLNMVDGFAPKRCGAGPLLAPFPASGPAPSLGCWAVRVRALGRGGSSECVGRGTCSAAFVGSWIFPLVVLLLEKRLAVLGRCGSFARPSWSGVGRWRSWVVPPRGSVDGVVPPEEMCEEFCVVKCRIHGAGPPCVGPGLPSLFMLWGCAAERADPVEDEVSVPFG